MSEGIIVGAPPIRPVLLEAFSTCNLTLQRRIDPWVDPAFAERYLEALDRGDPGVSVAGRSAWPVQGRPSPR